MKKLYVLCLIAALCISFTKSVSADLIEFSGDSSSDFAPFQPITDGDSPDVGMPPSVINNLSGLDISAIYLVYETDLDTLYVGITCYSICGDVDGDGDPGAEDPNFSSAGGDDFADMGVTETLAFAIDITGNDVFDFVFGVPRSGNLLLDFIATDILGSFNESDPSTNFSSTIVANLVLSQSPSADFPDLQFKVVGFKGAADELGLFAQDLSDLVNIIVFTDSAGASGIGSDTVVEFDYPLYDKDQDGLTDDREIQHGTDPHNPDTDGDGCLDGQEDANNNGVIDVGETDPNDSDSDDDGLSDCQEDKNGNGIVDPGETDPLDPDTDGDGLTDGQEDQNGNGEVDTNETDPLDPDTDGDGLKDGTEVYGGDDPNHPLSNPTDPLNPDTDGGGCMDGFGEDTNLNGRIDPTESNPNLGADDICDDEFIIDPNLDTDNPNTQVGTGSGSGIIGQGSGCSLQNYKDLQSISFTSILAAFLVLMSFVGLRKISLN